VRRARIKIMNFLKRLFKKNRNIFGEKANYFVSGDKKLFLLIETTKNLEIVDEVIDFFRENYSKFSYAKGELRSLLEKLNEYIYSKDIKNPDISLVALHKEDKNIILANLGRARIYSNKNRELIQITDDDSEGWKLFKSGIFDEEKVKTSELSKILTNSLGKNKKFDISMVEYYYEEKEKFLLCSSDFADSISSEKLENYFLKEEIEENIIVISM